EIELHDVGSQPEDVPQVREACSDVVDRNLRAALTKRCKCSLQLLVVVDLSVLGDLDHDPISDVEQQLAEAAVERSGRGDVERESDLGREVVEMWQRRTERGEYVLYTE